MRLTKRETVSYMHETVTGIRQSAHLFIIGTAATQSIAIDEIFSKKPVHEGVERSTMTLRNTKATNRQTSAIHHASQSSSETGASDEDMVKEVPTSVMRGTGLCRGKSAVSLTFMVLLWMITTLSYGMIGIYLKHLPGSIYINLTISGLSEIAAHVIVGIFYIKLTPRWTFFIGYVFAVVGGVLLCFEKRYADH